MITSEALYMQLIKYFSVSLGLLLFSTSITLAKPVQATSGQALIALAQSQQIAEFKFSKEQGAEVSVTPTKPPSSSASTGMVAGVCVIFKFGILI